MWSVFRSLAMDRLVAHGGYCVSCEAGRVCMVVVVGWGLRGGPGSAGLGGSAPAQKMAQA